MVLLEAKCSTDEAGICLFIAVPKGLTKSSSDNFLFGFERFELIFVSNFFVVLVFESLLVFLVFEIVLKLEILSSVVLSFFSDSSWFEDSIFKEVSLVWIDNFLFEDLTLIFFCAFSFVLLLIIWGLLFEFAFCSVFGWLDMELLSGSWVELFSCFDSFDEVSCFILSKVCFKVLAIAGLKSSIFL